MNESEIRSKIKRVIANVSGIDIEEIGDNASFEEDLDLDSLVMLEISVDIDLEFKAYNLSVPEEELAKLLTVQDAVNWVKQALFEKT